MFSIYILTYNEEQEIAACIESALLCDDVIVVDSFSSDSTIEIAQKYSVQVVQHHFESHGQQRSWMLKSVPSKYQWAYILEADERMTPELFQECLQAVQDAQHVGYYVAERVMFMNAWIRHSTQYPRYQLRLLHKDYVWFDDYGHTEREVCKGSTGFLQQTYPHYTAGKGFSRWLEKHNRYSSDEAQETVKQLSQGKVDLAALFFGATEVKRRRALKDLSLRIPGRPVVRFIYMYVFLKGFLDGQAGFVWCLLQAFYEYLITLKVWEIRNNQSSSTMKQEVDFEPNDLDYDSQELNSLQLEV
ncbi:MAG: glycosyltransferase family 2 protein [Spirulinaceae cyanobacterium]